MTDLDISKGLIIRELKQLWWWPQQQLQKTIGFMRKKTALHIYHTFQYISLTSTEWPRGETPMWLVFWRTSTHDDKFSFLFLNLDKVLKNSTPGKVACTWHIEQVQIDTIKIVPNTMITCHFSCGDPENESPALLCFSLICLQQGESWYLYLHFLELCCKEKKESFLCVEKLEFTINEGCNEI